MTKQTLLQIDNVRIREHDSYNLVIERCETTYNPFKKEETIGYQFKAYASTVTVALKLIMMKGLLIDKESVSDLKGHLKQVQDSEQKILDKLEEYK